MGSSAVGFASPAVSQSIFDPRSFRKKVAGGLTQVMVLGSVHLSAFSELKPEMLGPVLQRLAKFKPDLITIEALSGETLSQLEAYTSLYADLAQQYGKRQSTLGKPAEVATGLTRPQATRKARDLLAAWPAVASSQDRRKLVLLLAASGDPASALVQWLRLAPTERIAADGVTNDMVHQLNDLITTPNENFMLAARLAADLGLERVHPVDDHTADDAGDDMSKAALDEAGQDIGKADSSQGIAYHKAYLAASSTVKTPETLLGLYRWLNLPENQRLDAKEQWLSMLSFESPHHLSRVYNGWWETRNLRMVANIREAVTSIPGGRALVVVGASHKPYFDAYLDMMPDIHVVDVEAYLTASL